MVTGFINIWIAIRENLPLCPEKFYQYCQRVKALYVQECPEYSLNPSTLKILDHLWLILKEMPSTLSIGMFSEEPLGKKHALNRYNQFI